MHILPLPDNALSPSNGAPPIYVGLVGEKHLAAVVAARAQYLDISFVPSTSLHEAVYTEPPVSQARAHQMAAASKSHVAGGDAFSVPGGARRKKKRGRGRSKPYDRAATSGTPPITHGWNKFLEFDHPWMPPAIPSWRCAMDAILLGPSVAGTLFVSPKTRERQLRYLTNWVRARPVWLFMLQVPGLRVTAVASQFWRSYLYGVPDDFHPETKVGHRRVAIKHIFRQCFADDRLDEDSTSPIRWHGHDFRELPEELAPMVVWEVFELGFRYELLALDRYLQCTNTPDGEACQEELLSRVFPGSCLLTVSELPVPDGGGLFARVPHRRVGSLNALRDVLTLWPACPPTILNADPLSVTASTATIEAAEYELASFYVNSLYRVAARPPLLPHFCPH
ncbi:hypothetical protein C8T65DRAFT_744889 [Cerioporus squamosus]|nr:hypothetical protein C8T65DRAFT_744889 [Cerioporus squamosus]